ncbi:hypothetical protein HUT06_13990 [Actinomadura sp. NAK00032]|uniref:hypothetical protein n=1 Tax=Actinomadura sp. NAK00032 TaxID=2742128 RepID=UPI0015919765|nr:hypothetical protein [Actinomadura sp. NAK00032]QKW35002.1 hypothetical protein HUT06_13990 [Actinomadura sp. NAK00032]
MTLPTPTPPELPPADQWPILTGPDCPNCDVPDDVTWQGAATDLDYGGAPVHLWQCGGCCAEWAIPAHHWAVLDGPDCPYCRTEVTCWAALAPDALGDLWTCEHGHEFVLTPEGRIILPEDAA